MPAEFFYHSQYESSCKNRQRDRRAKSAPTPECSRKLKFRGKLKKIKPKTFEDFTEGKISSWEDIEFANKQSYKKKKKKINSTLTASTANGEIGAKRNLLASKELKVYARDRTRKCPKNVMVPDTECILGDVFNEVLEIEEEGEKQNFFRESSATSSSSDSDEIYISDDTTEEDLDMQLEGISSLFGDHESIPVGNKEVERECGNLKEVEKSPNKNGFKIDNQLQWNDVQTLLSNMGIQIIRNKSTNNSMVKSTDDKKKKGCRELQRLKFNVNYDHSSYSRGRNTSS